MLMSGTAVAMFLVNRTIKVLANLTKGAYLLVHFTIPGKRFAIPKVSPALLRPRRSRLISSILWQTNFTDRVTFPVYLNYLFNRLLAPTYEYRLATDKDCAEFVATAYPGPISAAYQRLQIGAARADFWRLLILYKHGGVYLDMDAHLMWPLDTLIDRHDRDLFVTDRSGRMTNYFIASAAGNPDLMKVIDAIVCNIEANSSDDVFELTGPGAMRSALADVGNRTLPYRVVCDQGNFTNRYFQYLDCANGHWTEQQREIRPVRTKCK